ncbi:hypothetical protein ambt_16830 [Alteromonas naphthalenivorans]|uniref:Abasic site processing protein n=2 Tax=Alteromonas naphthalenivorans TaxID=715451 RepID=F5Z5E5_ALTNA|nr:hypothetical protein ambt_16830 [Alteromonas naphthalenivorans]
MCGFIQRVTDSPAVIALLEQIGLGDVVPSFQQEKEGILNFYPAFGKNPDRQIKNVIISPNKTVNATWWYDCQESGDSLNVGRRTTFNARDLDSPYWKSAVKHCRALVIATALGESKQVQKKKEHYLMEADSAVLIGAVYREFSNGLYSTAVITRPPHPAFKKYHEQSIPCFLPHDKQFISAWLSGADDAAVKAELNNPKIHTGFTVTKVKTFKGGVALSESERLSANRQQ